MSFSRLARLAGGHLAVAIATSICLAIHPIEAHAQDAAMPHSPQLSPPDRIRLAEARRIIATFGDSLWPGWSAAPNALILITQDHEFLLWHQRPAGFQRIGYDSLLATDVYARPRQFPPSLAATFPAVGGVPTIVIGTAEGTRMRSTTWVLTVAHEHFHQWQNSQPGYYAGVAALDLARGDSTGMWMLNYAFPYTTPRIAEDFARVSAALRGALADSATATQAAHTSAVDAARARLRTSLSAPDYRYLSFQLWQEGIARYTEYAIARAAAARHVASNAFRALPDAEPFSIAAERLRREILLDDNTVLAREQRVAFYPIGAALGLWLDESEPGWRARYLASMFSLDDVRPVKR